MNLREVLDFATARDWLAGAAVITGFFGVFAAAWGVTP